MSLSGLAENQGYSHQKPWIFSDNVNMLITSKTGHEVPSKNSKIAFLAWIQPTVWTFASTIIYFIIVYVAALRGHNNPKDMAIFIRDVFMCSGMTVLAAFILSILRLWRVNTEIHR